MACFGPLNAWRYRHESDGEVWYSIEFSAVAGDCVAQLLLPCGQCVGCRLEKSRQWAVRCVHESQLNFRNCFVTLTYDDSHLPSNGSLRYRDFQLFMKRTRRKLGPLRFFMCGEYGETTFRPHYHACLFGVDFDDRSLGRNLSSGAKVFESKTLQSLWPLGYSSVGDVTFESAAYVARYVLKKIGTSVERLGVVDFSTGELSVKDEEFVHMSLKPGIGSGWWDKYKNDVLVRDKVIIRGVECPVPRYYDKLHELSDPIALEYRKFDRGLKVRFGEGSEARLAVQESVTKGRLAFKRRSL